jgi:hypothetical protein
MPINRQKGIRLNKFGALGSVYSQAPGGVSAAIRDTLIRDAQARLVAINTSALVDNSAGIAGIAFTAVNVGGELAGSTAVVIDTTLDDWTRVLGSWIVDGFQVGDVITVAGSASNNGDHTVTAVTDLILTTGGSNLTTEGSQSDLVITSPGDEVITLANVKANSLLTGQGPFQVSATGAALTGGPGVVIATDTDDFTRDGGSWIDDGFVVGQSVTVTESASNNATFTVSAVLALTLTVEENLVDEGSQTDLVMTAPGVLPAGLTAATDYWVKRTGDNTYELTTTKAAAIDPQGSVVDITTRGIGLFRFQALGEPVALVTDDGTSETRSFTAASGDTSFDTIMTSYATLVERCVVAAASVGCGDINDGPGSGGSGTIAVTDVDVAQNTNDVTGTTYASAVAIVEELLNGQKTVANYISVLRLAVGLGRVPEPNNVTGVVDDVGVNGAGDAITNCVTTDGTTIAVSALETEIEALLVVLTDNIALLADQLDEVTDIAVNAEMGAYAA